MIEQNFYLGQQEKLKRLKSYRYFWVCWGIYSTLVFGFPTVYFLAFRRDWKAVLLITFTGLFTHYVLAKSIHIIHRKFHPYQRLNFIPPSSWLFSLTDKVADAFPSEHVSTMSALSLAVYFFSHGWGLVVFFVTLMASLARIVLGYHDEYDVLAGWVLGLGSAYAIIYWVAPMILK